MLQKTKRLWRNTFEYKGQSYRLNSWKYIYTFSDGSCESVTVDIEDANGVSGYSVCGVVSKLEDIIWLDETTLFDDDFILQKEKANEKRIQFDKDRYLFLKTLPKNISRNEYQEIVLNKLFKLI
jgi:hypothetical protein